MWSTETSRTADLDPAVVWRRWTDVACWPEDDPDTVSAHLDGPPVVGAKGFVKPRTGPRTRVVVVAAEPEARFDLESSFPGARMVFAHSLGGSGPHTVTHRVTIDGPLAWLWSRLAGRPIAKGLPAVVDRIVERARIGEGRPGD